jgi:DnaJ-class molecular chaperone
MTDLYGLLEIDRGASPEEIQAAYKRLSRIYHPDKGGDQEKFKVIVNAKEILLDSDKRAFYDRTGKVPGDIATGGGGGEESMGMGFGGMPFHFDVSSLFGMFGAGGPGRQTNRRRRGQKAPSKVEPLRLSLQQLYDGHSVKIVVDRLKFCGPCSGSGAARMEVCGGCRGAGMTVNRMQTPIGLMETHGPCDLCNGEGKRAVEACTGCQGRRRVGEKQTLDVRVPPGAEAGERFVFQEACSEVEEYEKAGDVELIITEPDGGGYGVWRRRGIHLDHDVELNLSESLLGCTVLLAGHPGWEEGLYVKVPAGAFTGDVYCLKGQGMPVKGETNKYGDLYLRIRVAVRPAERAKLHDNAIGENLKGVFGGGVRPVEVGEDTDVQDGLFLSAL